MSESMKSDLAQPRPVIESDYLETEEGFFFAVKGLVHPPDRVLACLRYVPDPAGDRRRAGQTYRRLYHFDEQTAFLQAGYSHYLAYEPTCRSVLQSVPWSSVRRVYTPHGRLQELCSGAPGLDPVEASALAFTACLQQAAGIPWAGLGLSGSVLIGLHTPRSDLDLTAHGEQNCWKVYQALQKLLAEDSGPVRRLDPEGMQALYAERSEDTRMDFAAFLRSERQKVNQGRFQERTYFIRFLKEPAEFGEIYGERTYRPTVRAEVQAVVTSHQESIFTPCRYPLEQVSFLHGPPCPDLLEVVSFRGRFCEQAQAGERVRAAGTLERVEEVSGRTWSRLILGNHRDDYLIPWR